MRWRVPGPVVLGSRRGGATLGWVRVNPLSGNTSLGAHKSCLVEKLSHYMSLDAEAEGHLAALEESEREFPRHAEVWHEREPLTHLYVVRHGWTYTHADMPDGRRQIVRVFLPGDIVGFPDIAFEHAATNLQTGEAACLCPFPKHKLDAIFERSPKLTALLFTLANRELACTLDMLRAVGRMSARERVCFFLLDLVSRLRVTNRAMTDTMRMPLSQSEIGDALGLTHTYVSRTIRSMEDDGLISRRDGTITLEQEERMVDLAEFTNRYERVDTSWFPTGA